MMREPTFRDVLDSFTSPEKHWREDYQRFLDKHRAETAAAVTFAPDANVSSNRAAPEAQSFGRGHSTEELARVLYGGRKGEPDGEED